MRNRLYIATFSDNAIENIRNYNLDIEYNHLCISENLNVENIENTIGEMKKDCNRCNGKKAIIHGPFTELSPDTIDPLIKELVYNRYEQTYDAAIKLGVNRVVLHSGYMPWIYQESWHLEKSVEFWKNFMKDKPDNFNIMIENVFEDNPYIMKKIVESINDPRVTICLDVGHANVFKNENCPLDLWIEELRPYITHMHIHNNYGEKDQHLKIQEGTIDMESILKQVEKSKYELPTYTIESMDSKSSIEWLGKKQFI